MIVKELESKLIAALNAAINAATVTNVAHQVTGAWQTPPTESESTVAIIAVALGLPSVPTYSTPTVSFTGAVTLAVREDMDTTHTYFVNFAEVISNLFKTWQDATYQQAFTALDVDGLSIDEVAVNASEAPSRDTANRVVTLTIPFTLSGSYRETTTNN